MTRWITQTSDWIPLVSLIISVAAFVYSFLSSTKRYELLSERRDRVLDWFRETTSILIQLRMMIESESEIGAGKSSGNGWQRSLPS